LRLDKYLWFARLTKTRPLAQQLIAEGHLRIDGQRCDKAHADVRRGQVLSFPLYGAIRVLRVETLPVRRGPSPEAQACYTDLAAPPSQGS
jgi:ribosome-associated heat shock protein Hsp15